MTEEEDEYYDFSYKPESINESQIKTDTIRDIEKKAIEAEKISEERRMKKANEEKKNSLQKESPSKTSQPSNAPRSSYRPTSTDRFIEEILKSESRNTITTEIDYLNDYMDDDEYNKIEEKLEEEDLKQNLIPKDTDGIIDENFERFSSNPTIIKKNTQTLPKEDTIIEDNYENENSHEKTIHHEDNIEKQSTSEKQIEKKDTMKQSTEKPSEKIPKAIPKSKVPLKVSLKQQLQEKVEEACKTKLMSPNEYFTNNKVLMSLLKEVIQYYTKYPSENVSTGGLNKLQSEMRSIIYSEDNVSHVAKVVLINTSINSLEVKIKQMQKKLGNVCMMKIKNPKLSKSKEMEVKKIEIEYEKNKLKYESLVKQNERQKKKFEENEKLIKKINERLKNNTYKARNEDQRIFEENAKKIVLLTKDRDYYLEQLSNLRMEREKIMANSIGSEKSKFSNSLISSSIMLKKKAKPEFETIEKRLNSEKNVLNSFSKKSRESESKILHSLTSKKKYSIQSNSRKEFENLEEFSI